MNTSDQHFGSLIDRRSFITHTVGAGFALAVLPISAWAITTPSSGLVAGPISIPTSDGKSMPAYRAMPSGKGPFPVILVIQEIFGVHEHIQDVCRRFAKAGYLAVAPSLYFRQGDATKEADMQKLMKEIVQKVPQSQVWGDLDSLVGWLAKPDAADGAKANLARIGITGFCWGGSVVWTYSTRQPQNGLPKIKAGVAWYGKINPDSTALQPRTVLEMAPKLETPVLGLYGGKDAGIPQTDVLKLRTVLDSGKSGSRIDVYPEAEHGFHADYRPSYNEAAAKDGWAKALAWFKSHGV